MFVGVFESALYHQVKNERTNDVGMGALARLTINKFDAVVFGCQDDSVSLADNSNLCTYFET